MTHLALSQFLRYIVKFCFSEACVCYLVTPDICSVMKQGIIITDCSYFLLKHGKQN